MLDSFLIAFAALSVVFGLVVHVIILVRARQNSGHPLLNLLDLAIKHSQEKVTQAEKRLEEHLEPSETDLFAYLRRIAKASDAANVPLPLETGR